MSVSKEQLLKSRVKEDTVTLPGIGDVRVRGMNREEALEIRDAEGTAQIERLMLARGMVDPPLTEEEALEWQRNSDAIEIDAVTTKIAELSGMTSGAAKAAVRSFRDDAGPGVRTLSGGETEDDGGDAAPGDVG